MRRKALIVIPAGRVPFSAGLTLGDAFSHAWLRAGIGAFAGWALPTPKTVFRTWSDVAGTMIKAGSSLDHRSGRTVCLSPGHFPATRQGVQTAGPSNDQSPGTAAAEGIAPIGASRAFANINVRHLFLFIASGFRPDTGQTRGAHIHAARRARRPRFQACDSGHLCLTPAPEPERATRITRPLIGGAARP